MALSTGAKVSIAILLVVALSVAGVLGFAAWSMGGESGEGETVVVELPRGAAAAAVGEKLEEQGIIRSALAFRLRARSRSLDRGLKAGRYEFETGMGVDEAIDVLLEGPMIPEGLSFTISEGLTVEEILDRLADQTPHSVADYRQVLEARALELPDWVQDLGSFGEGVREPYEGLFFPETYQVDQDASPQRILQRMVDQLARVFEDAPTEWTASASERQLSRYEILILASLVEREAQIAEERSTIAGVIQNRLDADRALEVDASLLYAANTRGRVTADIRNVEGPYNLYEVRGLPPTPIGVPGRAAIEAAYQPEEHDYLYYAKKDEDGSHAFAETFEEHRRNVQELRDLQSEAERERVEEEAEQRSSPSPNP